MINNSKILASNRYNHELITDNLHIQVKLKSLYSCRGWAVGFHVRASKERSPFMRNVRWSSCYLSSEYNKKLTVYLYD